VFIKSFLPPQITSGQLVAITSFLFFIEDLSLTSLGQSSKAVKKRKQAIRELIKLLA